MLHKLPKPYHRLYFLRAFTLLILCGGVWTAELRANEPSPVQKIFTMHCAPCHGPDGRAQTAAAKMLKVRDLTLPEVAAKTDDELRETILKGFKDEKGIVRMTPFENTLKPHEVTALIRYIRTLAK